MKDAFKCLALALAFALPAFSEPAQKEKINTEELPLFSVDYPNADLVMVLRDVADRCHLRLVIPETLVGRTSVKLRNVTWRQIFDVVLTPLNYTYVEQDGFVRVVSRDELTADRPESKDPSDDSWWWTALVRSVIAIIIVCQFVLFIGILRDSPNGGTRFAPQFVWAVLVLVGGVFAAASYWVIHHSNLRLAEHDQ